MAPVTTPVRDPASRERPLNAIDDNRQIAGQRQLKPPVAQEKKRSGKVKPSSLCLTPPAFIQGSSGEYQRGVCIGEGGFARCFQVNDKNGELFAAKTLAKAALSSEKTRSKLITEIKLHRALTHPNIVKFIDCFEDRRNVYMLLEMCSNQSLADMVSRRRHLTEPEARVFLVEILGATHYMHSRSIVHRDMKLGNIFLDKDMNLKIGDFGLAARVQNNLRRRTVCGTPNYISPEVLVRPHEHSFETDMWAIGVILYAMLVGRPPFQDRDIDTIYHRIRHHQFGFPPAPSQSLEEAWCQVGDDARDLCARLLHPDPFSRPSIRECLKHPFIQNGVFVSSIPTAALHEVVLLRCSAAESRANLNRLATEVGLCRAPESADGGAADGGDADADAASAVVNAVANAAEVAQTSNEKVLPTSISPPSTREKYREIDVPVDSPAASQAEQMQVPDYDSPVVGRAPVSRPRALDRHESPVNAHRDASAGARFRYPAAVRTSTSAAAASNFGSLGPTVMTTRVNGGPARLMPRPASTTSLNITETLRASLRKTLASIEAVRAKAAASTASTLPSLVEPVDAPVIVTRWADFEESWGISYTLSDGSVGMLYRDRTSMRMDPMFSTYMYFEGKSHPGMLTVHRTAANADDPRRRKKMDVLSYVRRYMDRELAHAVPVVRPGGDVASGEILYYLTKSSECVMFVMTDGTLQFNFRDHFKAVVYDNGSKLGLVTDHHQLFCWKLEDALVATRASHFQRAGLQDKLATIWNETQRYLKSID